MKSSAKKSKKIVPQTNRRKPSKATPVKKKVQKNRENSGKKKPVGKGVPPDHTKFKPGTSGNLKGRPPKLFSSIMAELKLKGYERVSASQIIDGFETILNMNRKQLTDYATRTDVPIIMNVVAVSMLDKNKRAQMLEMMLDRVHGKAKQQTRVIVDDNKAPDLKDKTFEELYQLKYGKKPN